MSAFLICQCHQVAEDTVNISSGSVSYKGYMQTMESQRKELEAWSFFHGAFCVDCLKPLRTTSRELELRPSRARARALVELFLILSQNVEPSRARAFFKSSIKARHYIGHCDLAPFHCDLAPFCDLAPLFRGVLLIKITSSPSRAFLSSFCRAQAFL